MLLRKGGRDPGFLLCFSSRLCPVPDTEYRRQKAEIVFYSLIDPAEKYYESSFRA